MVPSPPGFPARQRSSAGSSSSVTVSIWARQAAPRAPPGGTRSRMTTSRSPRYHAALPPAALPNLRLRLVALERKPIGLIVDLRPSAQATAPFAGCRPRSTQIGAAAIPQILQESQCRRWLTPAESLYELPGTGFVRLAHQWVPPAAAAARSNIGRRRRHRPRRRLSR